MIKKIKYLIFFLLYIFLSACSFDKATGIWSGAENEEKRIADLEKEQNKVVIKIYSSENIYDKEIAPVKNVTLTKPRKNSSWQMAGLNLQNFVGNLYLTGIDNKFLKKKIGKDKFKISSVKSSPLVVDDSIIMTDDAGTIFRISQRGKVYWKNNIYKKLYKKIYKNLTLSIYKNKIYVADNIGFIYAINLENGKPVWIKNHRIPIKSNLKIFDDKIFFTNQDNRLICLDIKKGSKIWDIRSVKSFIKSQDFLPIAISKTGDLISLNSSGDLLRVKSNSGRIYWSLNTTGSMLAHDTDFFKSSNLVISDKDIIFSAASSLFSYSYEDGYLNWQQNIETSSTPIVVGKNIFLVSNNGYFVNLNRNSGKIIWSVNILKNLKKKKRETRIVGTVMGSGKIYAATANGFLIVCSASSGKVESIKKIGDNIATAPIINNGSLYILTEKSRILGFN